MTPSPGGPTVYEFGGSLPADAPTYVVRAVDDELFTAIRAGQLCYVLNARQMGKSSLRVRTMERLRALGVACADVDLSLVGASGVSAEEWYAGIIDSLASRLGLPGDLDLAAWWQRQAPLPPVMRLAKFFDEVTAAGGAERVVFFDEIDALLGLDFGDDFFSLLRAWHERGAGEPPARRLTFVLVGVATPTELIQDPRRSPFNIGRAIHLEGFRLDEARPALLPGLSARFADPEAILRHVLFWTGGQPFLTQKLCSLAMAASHLPETGDEETWVAELVRTRILENWETQDEPVHLRTIRDRLLEREGRRTGRLLGLYQKVLEGRQTPFQESLAEIELRLSGLVIESGGRLRVANPIYAAIFELEWVRRRLSELRPYAAAFAAWEASGRRDLSSLLRGEALQSARAWSADKSLSDEDYQFLEASGELERKGIQAALEEAQRLVEQAELRSRRLKRVGLAVLGATLTLSLAVLVFSWRALVKLRIQGEVASYFASIAQDPAVLRPAEMETFRRLAASSEETRIEFLREALASPTEAARIDSRKELTAQALGGGAPGFQDRLLREMLLPCLRSQPPEIRQVCLGFIGEVGGLDQPSAELVFQAVGEALESAQDLRQIDRLTAMLPGLAGALPRSHALWIFERGLAAGEKALALVKSRSEDSYLWYGPWKDGEHRPGLEAGLGSRLEEIAVLLPPESREKAADEILVAAHRFPPAGVSQVQNGSGLPIYRSDVSRRFWARIFAAVPVDLSPALRQAAFAAFFSTNDESLTRLVKKIRQEDRGAAFSQLLQLIGESSPFNRQPDLNRRLTGEMAAGLSPGEAGTVLRQSVQRLFALDLPNEGPDQDWLLPVIRVTAARAQPADAAQVGEEILAHREKALAGLRYDQERWVQALQALPLRLPLEESRRLLPRLLAKLHRSAQGYPDTIGGPFFDPLGEALVTVAAKTEPGSAIVPDLVKALAPAEEPRVVKPLVRALGLFPAELSPEDSRRVIRKSLDAWWNKEDMDDLTAALRAVAGHVPHGLAQDVARQVIASIDLPERDPWEGPTPMPIREPRPSPLNFFQPQLSRERLWEVDERKLLLAAEVLAALPQGDATASAAKALWPVITGALMCEHQPSVMPGPGGITRFLATRMELRSKEGKLLKVYPQTHDCDVLAKAVQRIPGPVDAARVRDLTEAVGARFKCDLWNREMFRAVIGKVRGANPQEAIASLLHEMDKRPGPYTTSCLLVGLAAQKADLSAEQLQRIFTNLLPTYLKAGAEGRQGGSQPMLIGPSDEPDMHPVLAKEWAGVVERTTARDVPRALALLLPRLADPGGSPLAAKTLPALARKVPADQVPAAFDSLIRPTAALVDADLNQAIAGGIAALPAKIPIQSLIHFGTQPQCVGPLRQAVITQLERLAGRSFAGDLRASLAWAREQTSSETLSGRRSR